MCRSPVCTFCGEPGYRPPSIFQMMGSFGVGMIAATGVILLWNFLSG